MSANGLNLEATTIHRMLGVSRNGHDGKGWGFLHCPCNPLPYRFIIIDEASMLDTTLAANIFKACAPGTHVLLVGDPYQLPPVGHGAPLRDLLERLPSGELTEIQRNAGDIVRVCQDIRSGRPYNPSQFTCGKAGGNVKHWETRDASHSMGVLQSLLTSPPPGLHPVWDMQILCAVNEKSDLSRKNLNAMLQELFNPAGERVKGCPFRIGDKVICKTNSMLPIVGVRPADLGSDNDDAEVQSFVANGEIGEVVELQPKIMHVKFETPARTVRVLFGKSDEGSEGASCDFDLGYAITTHKAQGSQAKVIVTLIDDSGAANQVCTREWHLTAFSRPERLLLTIGKQHIVNKQCRKVGLRDRKTFLQQLMN